METKGEKGRFGGEILDGGRRWEWEGCFNERWVRLE